MQSSKSTPGLDIFFKFLHQEKSGAQNIVRASLVSIFLSPKKNELSYWRLFSFFLLQLSNIFGQTIGAPLRRCLRSWLNSRAHFSITCEHSLLGLSLDLSTSSPFFLPPQNPTCCINFSSLCELRSRALTSISTEVVSGFEKVVIILSLLKESCATITPHIAMITRL